MQETDPMLVSLLQATVEAGASDLHLTVGRPATARRDGTLVSFENVPVLTPDEIDRMIHSLLDERKLAELRKDKQVDFSFGVPGLGRFRANAFSQRGTLALALRVVPFRVRSLEELGAPAACTTLLNKPYGIVLVVGPTGSGKSTTLAAMIDRINATRPVHILTIEDPVEYLHHHKVAMINQREVGTDVETFEAGLKSALREDPDVVLLGEMRDLESISISLSLAETGHLVFATLHTNDAAQALDRIIDVFPAERRDQIQIMLAGALQGVISQRLLPAIGGGRVAAIRGDDGQRGDQEPRAGGQVAPDAQHDRHRCRRGHADDRDGPRPPRGGRSDHDGDGDGVEPVPEGGPGAVGDRSGATPGAGNRVDRPGRFVGLGNLRRRSRTAPAGAADTDLGGLTDGRQEGAVQEHRRDHAVPGWVARPARTIGGHHGRGGGGVRGQAAVRGARLPPLLRGGRDQRADGSVRPAVRSVPAVRS